MLKDVNISVTDGGLSAGGTKGEGVHLKIGASTVASTELIAIRGTYDAKRIKQLLGISPLADACMDSIENGASLIYCMPVVPSVKGSIGNVSKTGTGTGTMTITGDPNNSFNVVAKITAAGGFNTALFTYSINGGLTTSDEITMPLTGNYAIPNSGLTLTFKEGATTEGSFVIGDTFKTLITAPALNNSDITSAIGKIKNLSEDFEFTHIVGEATAATWAAVSAAQKNLLDIDKLPQMFVLESYAPTEETVEAYATSLINARKTLNNYDIQIIVARADYQRMDGSTKNINMAGVICGLYAKAKVHQSIGETKSFALSKEKAIKLQPEGIENQIQYLDEAGYLTLREYVGLDGYFVTNARVACPPDSDYKYAEHTRVKNKIIKKIRKEALLQMQSDIDLTDVDGSLKTLGKILEAPLDDMVAAKEISSGRIIIPDGQDILSTEKVNLKVRFIPKGYFREFEIDLGMERLV